MADYLMRNQYPLSEEQGSDRCYGDGRGLAQSGGAPRDPLFEPFGLGVQTIHVDQLTGESRERSV